MGFNNWRSLLTESNSDWRLYNDANKHFRRRLFFFLTKYSTSEGRSSIKKSMRIRANNFVVIRLLLVPLWKMKPPVDPNPWKMQDLSRPKLLSTVILRILILWYICFQWEKVKNYSRLSCLIWSESELSLQLTSLLWNISWLVNFPQNATKKFRFLV